MYKGDVSPRQAYEALTSTKDAVLIDVRTPEEWNYVGVPMMPEMIRASWPPPPQSPDFVHTIRSLGVPVDAQVYIICRSGIRSANAASQLTQAGYLHCYNVAEGFEGDRDRQGHRGTIGGWKVAGLPWVQG